MGGWADEIEVRPGRDENEEPFSKTTATHFATVDSWIYDRDPDFDYGVIHLDEDLGEQTGWFGFSSKGDLALSDSLVNISGYPADKNFGRQQWHHANRVLRPEANRIFYDVDTYGGQSGSPVWIYEDESDVPVVIGIHAYGVGGTPTSFQITANSGPRINELVFNFTFS